jgi:hypothetical protein
MGATGGSGPGPGTGSGPGPGKSIVNIITAAGTLAAAVIALFALVASNRANDRVTQDETQQNASKVYVEEAPKYGYAYAYQHNYNHLKSDPYEIIWIVMNASDVQIGNVWIEGKNGNWDFMNNVQGCSLYALPSGFKPVAIDFSDSYGQWRRAIGVGPKQRNFNPPSKAKLKLQGKLWGSPWWLDVPNCP